MRLTFCLILLALAPVAYGFIGGSFVPSATVNLRPTKACLISTPRRLSSINLRASHDIDHTPQQHFQSQQAGNNNGPQKMTVKQTTVPGKLPTGPTQTHPMSILEMRLRPLSEWKQTEYGFLLAMATPGLAKEDLSIEVVDQPVPPSSRWNDDQFDIWRDPLTSVFFGDGIPREMREPVLGSSRVMGHYLIVTGETKQKEKPVDDKHTMGFRAMYKPFSQKIRLPDLSDKDTLSATYENGILLVHVNYRQPERVEPKKFSVPIN